MRMAEELSDNTHIAFAALSLSIIYSFKGEHSRAVEYGEMALQKSLTPFDKASAQVVLGWARCRAGELNRETESLETYIQAGRSRHNAPLILNGSMCLGEVYLLTGQYDKARQTAEDLQEIADRLGARLNLAHAHSLLGFIALETDLSQAAPHLEKSIALFREIKAENELAKALAGLGRYHKQQGNMVQSRHYLTEALEIFERLGTLLEPEKVRKELAALL